MPPLKQLIKCPNGCYQQNTRNCSGKIVEHFAWPLLSGRISGDFNQDILDLFLAPLTVSYPRRYHKWQIKRELFFEGYYHEPTTSRKTGPSSPKFCITQCSGKATQAGGDDSNLPSLPVANTLQQLIFKNHFLSLDTKVHPAIMANSL